MSVDLELVSNLAITDTLTLLKSTDILKEKVVFIAGYLSHKHFQEGEIEDEELVTSDFLKELSSGLRVPTLNMVFLDHKTWYFLTTKHGISRPQNMVFLDHKTWYFSTTKHGISRPQNMVFLDHSIMSMYGTLKEPYRRCTKYFQSLLGFIDTPFSRNKGVCKRLTNVIFKGDVLHRSDRENQLGCLRCKEKLSQSSTSKSK